MKSTISRAINIVLWGIVLVYFIGAFVGLIKSNWGVDALKQTYDKDLLLFFFELGFILGMVSMGIAGVSYFIRQLASGRKFSEIPALYGDEYNRLERGLANTGSIACIVCLIGIVLTHKYR